MTSEEIERINTYLSKVCKKVDINPVVSIAAPDFTNNGYEEFYHQHFSGEGGDQVAHIFEEMLDEPFRHSEVYVSNRGKGGWFELYISFRFDPTKNSVYRSQSLRT